MNDMYNICNICNRKIDEENLILYGDCVCNLCIVNELLIDKHNKI